ncbi:UNVERIFIED_CONTAM: hypothetical protein PYX00_005116 [Menopon gallinae]|uniref:Uncharacterized protein n=1 Tax=Menopon gallinae TaxID=328185 RepID=A0AAW2HPQ6_9NEOP
MKLKIFLLFCVFGRHCLAASIGEGLTVVEEVDHVGDEVVPFEVSDPAAVDELEAQSSSQIGTIIEEVPEPVIRMEPEEPKMILEDAAAAVPYEVNDVQDGHFPVDVSPVATEEENCDQPPDLIDEVAAERAEREADVDLLRALDSVLAREETLGDVLKSEDVSLE